MNGYEVYKLTDGGFVVREAATIPGDATYREWTFASDSINQCFDYINSKIRIIKHASRD